MLTRLALRDFRNFGTLDMDVPSLGMTVVGGNGHGKSNLLEAVAYLSLLRSVRGARDADCVRFGRAGFHIHGDCGPPAKFNSVTIGFDRTAKVKKVTTDGVPVQRLSAALGAVPSVSFSPSDVSLVAGGPAERRRYLDVILSLATPGYLPALQKYRNALAHRNAELRTAQKQGRFDRATEDRIAAWEPLLAREGALIMAERAGFVSMHGQTFTSLVESIGEYQAVEFRYLPSLLSGRRGSGEQYDPGGEPHDTGVGSDARNREAGSEFSDALLGAWESQRRQEMRRGTTLAGPHRDALQIVMDERELRVFGSAGQQRSAAIALRLLELAVLRNAIGYEPLLLLDDPFAELDSRRSSRVLTLLNDSHKGQVLLAVPRAEDVPEEFTRLARFVVRTGVLTRMTT